MPNIVVIDANVVISALLGSKAVLSLIPASTHSLYAPDKIIEEVAKYEHVVCEKTESTKQKFEKDMNDVLEFVTLLPYADYAQWMPKAHAAIGWRHPPDVHYLACALTINADFIWTNDKDFTSQKLVPVKTTKRVITRTKILKYLNHLISSKMRER